MGFYESVMYLYTPDGLKEVAVPRDVEFQGISGEKLILYLQSDWNVGQETFSSGSLVSFDLPAFLSGTASVQTIWLPDERSSFSSVLTTKDFIVISTLENVQSKTAYLPFKRIRVDRRVSACSRIRDGGPCQFR
ncbi:MAG: hypothetical protein MZV63_61150 [Marinilabiliales bacterium]|nr:hypothetical protein [Marinilabiliales bacterium]